jgi:transcriptional regulator with XRE-family HTH domain
VDEQSCLKAKQQSDEFNRAYGVAIRKIRETHKLLQSNIKGLTPRQLRRIETGKCRATYNALCKLAQAHEMSISEYLGKLAELTD